MKAFSASFLLLIVAAMAVTACAPSRAIIDATAMNRIIWPGPPETPRIKYLWSLSVVSGKEKAGFYEALMGDETDFTDPQTAPTLVRPYSVFADGQNLYVTDTGADRVTIINLKTSEVREITSAGKTDLQFPVGVVAFEDRIYVSDSVLKKVYIFDGKGRPKGELQGTFMRPTVLAIDRKRGVIYVSDTLAHKIDSFDLRGMRLGSIGHYGAGKGEFNFPTHLWVDDRGRLYVTDAMNFRIEIFTPAGKFLGMFGSLGDASQNLDKPKGVATDSDGNVYVVDSIKDTVKIFNRRGDLLLMFGQEGKGYGDFWLPSGIFIDGNDTIYVADTYNGRVQAFQYVRKKK